MIRLVLISALLAACYGSTQRINDPRLHHRIVGGEDTYVEVYPYQVSVRYNDKHICGGTIISSKFILTSAFCTYGYTPTMISIRAGSTYHNAGGIVVNVQLISYHPKHDMNNGIDYDISILELDSELTLGTKSIDSIPLPAKGSTNVPASKIATITGWGGRDMNELQSVQLQVVNVETLSNDDCDTVISQDITDNMMCAWIPGKSDVCSGDEGGPMVIDGLLEGVTSFGVRCGSEYYSSIYTRVTELRDFISEVTGV